MREVVRVKGGCSEGVEKGVVRVVSEGVVRVVVRV